MIIVVGSGLVAISAAHRLLDFGHDVTLTTAHAEFGFPHGGCGLWNTDVLPWPLTTFEEAVATTSGSLGGPAGSDVIRASASASSFIP